MALATIYIALIISSMFVPSWLMTKLNAKRTMVLSMLGYNLFIAAQFFPKFYTLLPSAAILGIAAAPLWIAKCVYLTEVSKQYSKITSVPSEEILAKIFSVFFFFFQTSIFLGNLISSTGITRIEC